MLDQPSSNVTLPEALQSAIDSARENLGITETRNVTLSATNNSLTKDNGTLLKRKDYLESQIVDADTELKKINSSIDAAKKELAISTTAKNKLDKEIAKKIKDQSALDDKSKVKEDELMSREIAIKKREDSAFSKETELVEKENKLEKKLEKLKELMT